MNLEAKEQSRSSAGEAFADVARTPQRKQRSAERRVTLRLSSDEYKVLSERATGRTLSAYIRQCVFDDEVKPRKMRARTALKSETALARVLGLLGQSEIASNLSELATYAREGSLLLDDATHRTIREAHAAVVSMRSHLLTALGLIDGQNQ